MNKKKKERITFAGIINSLILGLFTFICVYPLWYIFINSWSSPAAVNRGVYLIPREFSVEAYTNLLEIPGLTSSIGIAFARTILGTLLTLMCCSFAAYILANRDLPCRKLLYRFFIITMYVNAGFIPYYLLISNIKLKNNFLVYILPYAVQAYFIILIKTYIESIPGELVESAEMDGAGLVKVFFRIILPLAKPGIATIGLFVAVAHWNDWFTGNAYMLQDQPLPLQTHLRKMISVSQQELEDMGSMQGGRAPVPETLKMGAIVITTIPIGCVFPFIQKYFVKGLLIGSVKE